MFKRRDNNEEPTVNDKQRAINNNLLICICVTALLVYQFVEALIKEGEAPIWFYFVMPLLIIGSLLLAYFNHKKSKALKKYIEENETSSVKETKESISEEFDDKTDATEPIENEKSIYDE